MFVGTLQPQKQPIKDRQCLDKYIICYLASCCYVIS